MKSDAAFYTSLAQLHRAGVPWPEALDSASGGAARYEVAVDRLRRGDGVAEALHGVVDPLDEALIRAGEQGGSLERVLREIAETHHDAASRRRARRTGLFYPTFVICVAALLLPLPDLLQGRPLHALGWSLLVVVPALALFFALRRADRRERRPPGDGQPPEPGLMLGPLASRVEEADARALSALGRLYDAGVPILAAVPHAVAAGWGGRVARDLSDGRGALEAGAEIGSLWQRTPPEIAGRLRTAEHAGSLGEAAVAAAADLSEGVSHRRQRTLAVLPVVVMVVLGGIVAWRVIGFYADMYGRIGR